MKKAPTSPSIEKKDSVLGRMKTAEFTKKSEIKSSTMRNTEFIPMNRHRTNEKNNTILEDARDGSGSSSYDMSDASDKIFEKQ
jgi:patatin-like phospholipase/acyl hydrolase